MLADTKGRTDGGEVHSVTNFGWSLKHRSLLAILLSTLLNPFYPSAFKRATIWSSNKNSQWLSIKFGFPSNPLPTLKSWAFLAKLHNARLSTPALLVLVSLFCRKSRSPARPENCGKHMERQRKTAANKGNNSDDMRSTQFSPSSTLHRVRPETMICRV